MLRNLCVSFATAFVLVPLAACKPSGPTEPPPDPCATWQCENGGTCVATDGGLVRCACAAGFSGPTCAKNIWDCGGVVCFNGSVCVDEINGFSCSCTAAWTGTYCNEDVNECLGAPCKNGGWCENQTGSFVCHCPKGYSGTTCETVLTPKCEGYASSCLGRSASTCENGSGCVATQRCSGSWYPCSGRTTSYDCERLGQCSWNSSTWRCTGPSSSCSSISQYSCRSYSGCSLTTDCSGYATSCGSLSTAQCTTQPGCSIQYR